MLYEVITILAQGREVLQHLRRLVLQPMRDIVMVRKWLTDNGWRLMDEEMVTEDGHYYVIIVAEPGFEKLKQLCIEAGAAPSGKERCCIEGIFEKKDNRNKYYTRGNNQCP